MTQPNVYWTLDTPLATIIGLYTNVPEGGHLDDTQIAWLNNELTSAPTGKALLVTTHHPPISADDHHGSSPYMMQLLDTAMQTTSRLPDLICTGHVHDFQRHTRDASAVGGTGNLTYLVAGAGGYHNLHTIAADVKAVTLPAPFPGMTGVMIEAFCDDHYGYLRLKVSPSQIDLQYVSVSPQPGVAPSAINPTVIDSATVPVRGG